jgi:hypothetical protein
MSSIGFYFFVLGSGVFGKLYFVSSDRRRRGRGIEHGNRNKGTDCYTTHKSQLKSPFE